MKKTVKLISCFIASVLLLSVFMTSCDLNIGTGSGTTAVPGDTTAEPCETTAEPGDVTSPEDVTTAAPETEASVTTAVDTTEMIPVTVPGTDKPADTDPGAAPTGDALIKAVGDFLNTPGVNGLLFNEIYDVSSDASLWQIVAQLRDAEYQYPGSIEELYKANGKTYNTETGSTSISAAKLDELMKLWTCVSIEDLADYEAFNKDYFLPTAGYYSVQNGGVVQNPVVVIGVKYNELDDIYEVRYKVDPNFDDTFYMNFASVTAATELLAGLQWIDGRFILRTNLPVWITENAIKNKTEDYHAMLAMMYGALTSNGLNGFLFSSFRSPLTSNGTDYKPVTEASLAAIVSQFKDSTYTGDIDAAIKAAGFTPSDATGKQYITGKNLNTILRYTAGYTLEDFLKDSPEIPNYITAEDLYYTECGGLTVFLFNLTGVSFDSATNLYKVTFVGLDDNLTHYAYLEMHWDGNYRIDSHFKAVG